MTVTETEAIHQWLTQTDSCDLPDVMQHLLRLEKDCKPSGDTEQFMHLLGTWRLTLIGGKQSLNPKSPTKKGKLLPKWLNIQLSYRPATNSTAPSDSFTGHIINQVQWGPLELELSGPWKFYRKPHIMAFDFLHLQLSFLGKSLLSRPIRGGKATESEFWKQSLKEQAFFRYFWITPQAIAARGRGGGIALWTKAQS